MDRKDIDTTSFPNIGNNPFYNKEFSVGAMLPQVPLYDTTIIRASIQPYADGLDLNDYDLEKVHAYTESYKTKSNLDKDHKQKGSKSLSSFKKIPLTESELKKYSKKNKFLRGFYAKDETHDTYIWVDDEDKVVGALCVATPKNDAEFTDNHVWVSDLYITPEYRGYGLSTQILDFACNTCKANAIGVETHNKVAMRLYEKYGFKYGKDVDKKNSSNKGVLLMYKESVQEPKPTPNGFMMAHDYGEKEVWNSLVIENGKRYREKVEVLILQGNSVLLRLKGNDYKLPGGSTEPKESMRHTAIRECQEEVRITPKNLKYYGSHKEQYTRGVDYDGYIAHIFVGQFDKRFTGKIAPEDVDEKMLKESRFYPLGEVQLNSWHQFAIDEYLKETGMKLESTEDVIEESWVHIEDNIEINLDDWRPGNPLWITGASGDGKSTLAAQLAKEYNAEIVTSDIVLIRVGHSPEKFMAKLQKAQTSHGVNLNNSPALDYVNTHPDLPYNIFDPINKKWDNARLFPQMMNFYFWFMKESGTNPKYRNRLFIIEGCNICQMPPEIMATKPLIIAGGSRLRSLYRRAKRDAGEKNVSIIKSLFKYITHYNWSAVDLDNDKEFFRNSVLTMMESVKRSELPDSVFGIPQERKYPMPDEKHTRSAMKLFNHCEKKYEEQLAKHIIKNIKKYKIDPSFVGPKNRLRKYLEKADLIKEGVIEVEDTNYILEQMAYDFFGDKPKKSDSDELFERFFGEASMSEDIKVVPDKIEPMVKKLENKHYRVKYASPGHPNTRFDNDRDKDGVINGKLVSTGRIIFERDYHFDGCPKGWEWKKLENGFRALYVKPFTYSGAEGHEKEAFKKWQSDYLSNLQEWIEALPMQDSDNPRNDPEKDLKGKDVLADE